LPLNLWFYHAQGLIVLGQPGHHFWIPALICCVLYAVSARLLKDTTFVPVFVLGVTATGLLILADNQLNRFWEISSPATLLVFIGLICIHAERIFPDTETPFGRKRFGLAFFWSGHVVLAAGLLLILGAQIFGGWLFPIFKPLYDSFDFGQPEIVTEAWGKLLALGLVLAGTYAYFYSDVVVRRIGIYIPIAVFTLLWSEVLLITLVPEWATVEAVILALALTALLMNLLIAGVRPAAEVHGDHGPHPHGRTLRARDGVLFRAGPPLGLILSTVPVIIGMVRLFQAVTEFEPGNLLTWSFVSAMVVTAVVCRVGAYLYRHSRPGLSVVYFFGTAAATMVAAAALLIVTWPESKWAQQAPMLMLIPIAYLVASHGYRGHTAARPLNWVAHTATVVMLFITLFNLIGQGVDNTMSETAIPNLLLALFFAEAAVFYVLAAVLHRHTGSVYLATLMGCAAFGLLLHSWYVAHEYYILAFAIIGLLLLIGYRLAILDRYGETLATAAFSCANALLSLAFVAGALMTLTKLVELNDRPENKEFLEATLRNLLLALFAINFVVLFLVRQQDWRRWYVVTTVVNAALAVLVLVIMTHLTLGQQIEIVCLVIGTGMLVAAHVGWYREQDRLDDMVSLGLFFGSLLVAVPLAVVVLGRRLGLATDPEGGLTTFDTINEIGMLVAALLLLSTGFLFQLRATTIVGSILLGLFLVSMLLFIRMPDILQTLGVYLAIGGGLFVGLALLLSIYRDRLLTLPDRIKRREGIFKVLSWR